MSATTERMVTEIWAWMVTDHLGNEGVLMRPFGVGHTPMIAETREVLEELAPLARDAAQRTRLKLTAARFVRFEDQNL